MYIINDKTAAIREIQRLLSLSETGVYDRRTINAVMNAQRSFGLEPNGRIDLRSFELLVLNHRERIKGSATGLPSLNNFPYEPGAGGDEVSIINSLLANAVKKLGFKYIPPRGRYYSIRTASIVKRLREIFLMEEGYHIEEKLYKRIARL